MSHSRNGFLAARASVVIALLLVCIVPDSLAHEEPTEAPPKAPAKPPAGKPPNSASGFGLRQREGLNSDERDYLGSPLSEAAIQKGLKWLAANQSPDGSWPNAQDVGLVGLCSMAFLACGHQPDRGPYGRVLRKSADFIVENCQRSGLIYNAQGSAGGPMYGHGFATLALAELYGQTKRPDLREKLDRAVDLIVRTQNAEGGWRYNPGSTDSDISIVICQVMALRAAHNAGVQVPRETTARAISYVKRCSNNLDGGFSYQTSLNGSNLARTGAGVLCLIVMGEPRCEQVSHGLEYLMAHTPEQTLRGEFSTPYAWYYTSQAMYQASSKHWHYWYPGLRDLLVKLQRVDGTWTDSQGVPYATSMALLALQVPSALLPIYQK